jgi:hypothetical protein
LILLTIFKSKTTNMKRPGFIEWMFKIKSVHYAKSEEVLAANENAIQRKAEEIMRQAGVVSVKNNLRNQNKNSNLAE